MGRRGNKQRGGGGNAEQRVGFRAPTAGHEKIPFVFGKPTSTADCEQAMTTLCRYLATMTVGGTTEYATFLEACEEPTFPKIPEPSQEEEVEKKDSTTEKKAVEAGLYKMRLDLHVDAVKQQNKEKRQHKENNAWTYVLLL